MTEEEKKSTEKATRVGFVFYMIALSVSSAYSFFIDSGFNISFLILMVGLIVFLPVILYSIKSLIKTIIKLFSEGRQAICENDDKGRHA